MFLFILFFNIVNHPSLLLSVAAARRKYRPYLVYSPARFGVTVETQSTLIRYAMSRSQDFKHAVRQSNISAYSGIVRLLPV